MATENPKRNLKDEKAYYELQQDIKDVLDQQNTSIGGFVNIQKKIAEQWKEIKKVEKEIAALEQEILEKGEENTLEAQKRLAYLRKELDQQKEINKQLVKQSISVKEIGKAISGSIIDVMGNVLDRWFAFDEVVRKTGVSMGLSSSRMSLMQDNIIAVGQYAQSWGVSTEQLAEAQGVYSDELGRSVLLSQESMKMMARIGTETGIGAEGVASIAASMDQFGYGAERSAKLVEDLSSEAESLGLNSAKVVKSFKENVGLMNKLNFKNGVKGLKEMVKFSTKFKIDMNAVAAVAEKVFRPEGAIEAAAQLQVLGGSLAALGDPFQLMYKARNAPEELAKSLTEAATASAVFNKKTGEFEVNANELDRLREASQALGMDYNNLVETAKEGAKIKRFEGLLGGKGLTQDEKDMLTGLADAEGKIELGVGEGGKRLVKDLSQLSKKDVEALTAKRKLADENQRNALSLRQEWENVLNQLIMTTQPLLKAVQDYVKPLLDSLVPKIVKFFEILSEWKKTIAVFLGGALIFAGAVKLINFISTAKTWVTAVKAALFGGTTENFKKGVEMGKGFNSVVMGKGAMGKGVGSALPGGGTPPATSGTPPSTTGGQSGGVLSQLSQVSPTQILATAVALVAIGAAIWLVADGMSHLALAFKELNGPQAFGAVAGMAVIMGGFVAILAFLPPIISAIGIAGEFAAPGLLAFGFSMLMIGGAIAIAALGFSVLVNSFTEMFKVIGPNGDSIMKAGIGFGIMAAGIGVLAFALVGLSASALLAVVGLGVILGLTTSIVAATTSLNSVGGAEGLVKAVNAINSVDENKLEALKSLSNWMALLGGTTTVKFDESLTVDGEITIKGEAGGKSNTDWVNNPTFVSNLKDAIFTRKGADRNYGKPNNA